MSCAHERVPLPDFDAEAARTMEPAEILGRYPRIAQTCPDCGAYVVRYASYEHYLAWVERPRVH